MTDVITESPDLKQELGSPGQKRKRSAGEQSPDDRRAKRGAAPAATMVPTDSALGFLEAAANDAASAGVGVDLSALQQANEAANHSEAIHQPVVTDATSASSTAAAALGSMYPTMHVPATTEQQFAQAAVDGTNPADGVFADVGHVPHDPSASPAVSLPPAPPVLAPNGTQPQQQQPQPPLPSPPIQSAQPVQHPHHAQAQQIPHGQRADYQYRKPAVGTEEWHKLRKDNHKEVERRRRETINEGINELAKIVPGCEKNKGAILAKAVQFIQTLKANETSNIEKWTLEKLLTEQAIGELSVSNEKLKAECAGLYERIETYKRYFAEQGIEDPTTKVEQAHGAETTANDS